MSPSSDLCSSPAKRKMKMIAKLRLLFLVAWHQKQVRRAMNIHNPAADMMADMCLALYQNARHSRYLFRKQQYRQYRPKPEICQFTMDLQSHDNAFLNESEFRQKYRMNRSSFEKILHQIETNPVFKKGSRGPTQAPVSHQLMSLLAFFGVEGNGSSGQGQRNLFKISVGASQQYHDRVVQAIIISLKERYYRWPDAAERRRISKRFFKKYGRCWPNLVGIADGTLNPLAFRPETKDAADYSGRKFLYSLSTMIFCDDKRRIRYFLAGFPGSAHDNRVMKSTVIYRRPHEFFSQEEFILTDSAMSPQWWLIPAFRKARNSELPAAKERFNRALAKPRILSEHTIGVWKGRFPFLKSIRLRIKEGQDANGKDLKRKCMKRICDYMLASVILHNFLIDDNDEGDEFEELEESSESESDDDSVASEDNGLYDAIPGGADQDQRRWQLLHYIDDLPFV